MEINHFFVCEFIKSQRYRTRAYTHYECTAGEQMCGQGRKYSFTQGAADTNTDTSKSPRLRKKQEYFFFVLVVGFKTGLRSRFSYSIRIK